MLNRNPLSRETMESSLFSLFRNSKRRNSSDTAKNSTMPRKTAKNGPMFDCAKACTEETIPLRVRNVPKIQRKKVVMTRTMFQTFSMPRFSWIITEWRNAVPASQGSSEAFSTGSQPQ